MDTTIFLEGHTKKIHETLVNVGNKFLYIGYLLWEVQEYNYYKDKYKNIVEYSEVNFGFNKSSTYRFINICMRFSTKTGRGTPTMFLDEKYKGYSISQLGEIINLSDEEIENLKLSPDMTIKEIRQAKKSLTEQEKKLVPTSEKFKISSFVKENINNLFEDSKQIDNFFKYAIDNGIIDKFLNESNNKIDEEAQKSNVGTIEDYPQISVEEVLEKSDPNIKIEIENCLEGEIDYNKIKREIQKYTKSDVDILDIYDLVDEKGINKIRLYLKNASQFEGKLLNAIKKEYQIDKGD